MVDDLLVRVDAQVSEFNSAFGSATKSTLQLEAALKRASAQQTLYQQQVARYGAQSAQAQSALTRAQMSNARLAEQQAAIQAKAAAEQKAALQAQATAYSRLGRTYATVGAGIVLALGASAKAAIDWQDQFARVRQALEGTPQQLQSVEQGLLGLSKELPATTDQLADMAQSAAQTGVATDDIVGFTKVVAELATTAPDLQDGATQLARFLNVTGTSTDQVENVASAMTKLGQAGASTVSEIADLGLRLAGAGRTARLSNGEILGFANAMTSLGLRVESAGTNFSQFLLTLNTAVTDGGKDLQTFAKVAGESAQEFARQYRDDSSKAIEAFLDGLERIRQSGGNVAGVLESLGITGQRQVDVLNRLSQNSDLLSQSLETGTQAYRDNTALQETFGKQAETTASRLQVASNNVRALAIGVGNELLPVLGDAAGYLSDVASALGDLPGPAKQVIVILGAAAGATTLFSGAQLLMKARLIESKLALEAAGIATTQFSRRALASRSGIGALGLTLLTFGANAEKSNDAVGTLTEALGLAATGFALSGGNPLGAAIGGAIGLFHGIVSGANDASGAVLDLNAETQDLIQSLTAAGLLSKSSFQTVAEALQTVGADAQAVDLGVPFKDLVAAAAGVPGALSRVNAQIDAAVQHAQQAVDAQEAVIRAQLAAGQPVSPQQMVDLRAAQALLARLKGDADGIRDAIGGQNKVVDEAVQAWKDHAAAEGAAAGAAKELTGALDTQKNSVDAARQAIASYNSEMARFLGKQIGVHQAIIDANKAMKDQKDGFRLGTQAGIDNTNTLLNLQSALQNVDSTTKTGARSFNLIAEEMIAFQHAQGRSIPEAIAHTKALLGISDAAIRIKKNGDVVVDVSANTHGADTDLDRTKGKADDLDRSDPKVDVSADTAAARSEIDALVAWINSRNATINVAASHGVGGLSNGPSTGATGGTVVGGIPGRDSVHILAMPGEELVNAKAAEENRPLLKAINAGALRFATGGTVPGGSGGSPHGVIVGAGLLTMRELLRLLARPDVPVTLARVNALYRERQAEERALQPLLEKQQRARENEKRAQQELNRLQRDDTATKKELADAQKNLNASERETREAERDVADQRRDLADATDKWRQAQQALVEQTKASVAQFVELGSAFGGEGTSLSAQGLLAKKRSTAADIKEFERDLRIIRRKGADKDLIAEIKAEGPTADALTLLRDLIRQPHSYFVAEARADAATRSAARSAATFGVGGGRGGRTQIHTQIQKQVNVHVHHPHVEPSRRELKREVRDAAEHALLIAGAP